MPALLLLLALVRPASAWEQLFLSTELTLTLGARIPFGFATSVQFGEAPVQYTGPDFRLVGEVSYGPNGWGLSAIGRAGLMGNGQFGYASWSYYPGPWTYTELGFTLRPGTWSGVRVGGGVALYFAAIRYHQLIPLKAVGPTPFGDAFVYDPATLLPLPRLSGALDPTFDAKIAFAFEAWMFPSPLGSVY